MSSSSHWDFVKYTFHGLTVLFGNLIGSYIAQWKLIEIEPWIRGTLMLYNTTSIAISCHNNDSQNLISLLLAMCWIYCITTYIYWCIIVAIYCLYFVGLVMYSPCACLEVKWEVCIGATAQLPQTKAWTLLSKQAKLFEPIQYEDV